MRSFKSFLCAALLLTAGCGGIPADSDGTLERIRASRSFKVGLIASGDTRVGAGRERALIQRVSADTGAAAIVETGAAEPLLARLEAGDLDLVLGALAPASPWSTRVTSLPPLGEQVDDTGHVMLVPLARNGENAWVALLHRHALAVAAQR